MIDAELQRYASQLGPAQPDVQRLLAAASRGDAGARIAKSVLRARLRLAKVNPDGVDNPFATALPYQSLGGDGVTVGTLVGTGQPLVWRFAEIAYSLLAVGSPGSGKTTGVIHLILQLALYFTIIVLDLRGDYESLCRVLPRSRLFFFGEFPINLLKGPTHVPGSVFNSRFSQIFTDRFEQRQASRRYLGMVLDDLDTRRQATGHWPCLLDLLDALEDRHEQRVSDALKFRDRCIARVDALRRELGERAVGVEQGIDLEHLLESRATLVFRLEQEQTIQDFIVNWIIMYAYEYRTWKEDKFGLDPILFVLDEQRSLLSQRR